MAPVTSMKTTTSMVRRRPARSAPVRLRVAWPDPDRASQLIDDRPEAAQEAGHERRHEVARQRADETVELGPRERGHVGRQPLRRCRARRPRMTSSRRRPRTAVSRAPGPAKSSASSQQGPPAPRQHVDSALEDRDQPQRTAGRPALGQAVARGRSGPRACVLSASVSRGRLPTRRRKSW